MFFLPYACEFFRPPFDFFALSCSPLAYRDLTLFSVVLYGEGGQPRWPSNQPGNQPASQPAKQPDSQPANQPTSEPANQPTSQTANQRTSQATTQTANQAHSYGGRVAAFALEICVKGNDSTTSKSQYELEICVYGRGRRAPRSMRTRVVNEIVASETPEHQK